jgi:hypothetical protein
MRMTIEQKSIMKVQEYCVLTKKTMRNRRKEETKKTKKAMVFGGREPVMEKTNLCELVWGCELVV